MSKPTPPSRCYANARLHDMRNFQFQNEIRCLCSFMVHHFMILLSISMAFHSVLRDFHSQNIMITDVDVNLRITAFIEFTASFAQYPLFIADHPALDEDYARNIQDQATFDELKLEAERNRNPIGGFLPSRLTSNSYAF